MSEILALKFEAWMLLFELYQMTLNIPEITIGE